MIISFGRLNGIFHFIVGMVISLVFNRYIYGSLIMIYSAFIGLQFVLRESNIPEITKYLNYTQIPAYVMLVTIVASSLYILSQSTEKQMNKIIALSQLSASVLIYLFVNFMKSKNTLFTSEFMNYVPTLFFIGFLISVSIIPDNQIILRRLYIDVKHKKDK